MTLPLDEIRNYFYSKVNNIVTTNYTNTFDIRYANIKSDPVLNKEIVTIQNFPKIGNSRALGGDVLRIHGICYIEAIAPENKGTKNILSVINTIMDYFLNRDEKLANLGYIYIRGFEIDELTLYNGRYTYALQIQYMFDQTN